MRLKTHLLIFPFILTWIVSCQPVLKLSDGSNSSSTEFTSSSVVSPPKKNSKPYVSKRPDKVTTKTKKSAKSPKKSQEQPKEENPDYWQVRYDELVEQFAPTWRRPELGKVYRFGMRNSKKPMQGKLLALTEGSATFAMSTGAELKLQGVDMHPKSQVQFFKKDAAHVYALSEMREEMRLYQRKLANAPTKRVEVASSPPPSNSDSTPATNSASREPVDYTPRNDPSRNGEVAAVKSYLLRKLSHPEKTRFIKWGKVQPDPRGSGYIVQVIYETYAGESLGMIKEGKQVFMNEDGFPYRQAMIRL